MTKRIKYLDVAKFFGIFSIYLGHFPVESGYAYDFVFAFHVPLFFFLAGCTEWMKSDTPWKEYMMKAIKGILIPFYIFGLFSVIVRYIHENTVVGIWKDIGLILEGSIRNQFFAGGIWFLTCLFVIKISFYLLRKLLKHRIILLVVSFILYTAAEKLISPRPLYFPHMIFNVDSACYYILFYALGYSLFEWINKFLKLDNIIKRLCFTAAGLICFIYAFYLFFGNDMLYFVNRGAFMNLICPIIRAMLLISLTLFVSKMFEDVKLFGEIGGETLYLCGSEYAIKLFVPTCAGILGLNISLSNPLAAYLYSFALLLICHRTLVPLEKKLFRKLHLIK